MSEIKHSLKFKFNLMSGKELYNIELPPIEYLVDNLIIKKGLTYLVGAPGTFKTGLMLLTTIAGACKDDVIEFNIDKPFKTLFIDEENGKVGTKDRFVKLVDGLDIDIDNLNDGSITFSNISGFRFVPLHVNELKEIIKEYKPDLVIIDNIARCLVGSERDEKDVSAILRMIKPIIEKYGTSFVIIHHTRKGNAKTLEDISGSRDFGGQCDNAFILREYNKKGDTKSFVLSQIKAKYGIGISAINFSVSGKDELHVEYLGTAKENIQTTIDTVKSSIIKWVMENPQYEYKITTVVNAMKKQGCKDTSIRTAIKHLENENFFVKTTFGKMKVNEGGKIY